MDVSNGFEKSLFYRLGEEHIPKKVVKIGEGMGE